MSKDICKPISQARGVKSGIAFIAALLTCPCHLPLVLPLLVSLMAGTVVGAWLSANSFAMWSLFTLLFVVSLFIALRGFGQTAQMEGSRE